MTPAVSPLTGAQYEFASGDYLAVVTELGAGLRELSHRGRPLIAGYQPDELPPGAAGQLLLPWPNRVDGGRYGVAGTDYQLDLSEPAARNAIHGLTRWSAWSLASHAPHEVVLRLALLGRTGYPFRLDLEVEYHLSYTDGLTVRPRRARRSTTSCGAWLASDHADHRVSPWMAFRAAGSLRSSW